MGLHWVEDGDMCSGKYSTSNIMVHNDDDDKLSSSKELTKEYQSQRITRTLSFKQLKRIKGKWFPPPYWGILAFSKLAVEATAWMLAEQDQDLCKKQT